MSVTAIPDEDRLFTKKDLKRLIVPLIIEQALALTVGMIDTVMVASAGESAVSGVSLVETINILLINLFAALATGGAVVAGQYLGKRDRKNSIHAAKQLVLVALFLSSAVMIVFLVLNRQILSMVFGNVESDVMANARTYFYLTTLSYPFIALYNSAAALFRGMGNSKISMVNALVMNVVNIIGNALFIFGFGWGVFGAALSTLISRMVAAATMLFMLRNPNLVISIRNYSIKDIDFSMIKRILKIGIPNGLENSMFQFGKILLVSLISLLGTTAIAANAVGNSIAGIEIIPGSALGLAMTTVVSRCVGAGEYDQAYDYIKRLLKTAYFYMLILNIVILLLVNPILSIYNLSDETFEVARQLLVLHGVCSILIWPTAFSLPNSFRAAGDVKFTMFISILSMWTFRIGLSYLLIYRFNMGVISVWIAMIVDWVFRSICFLWRLFSGRWRGNAVV